MRCPVGRAASVSWLGQATTSTGAPATGTLPASRRPVTSVAALTLAVSAIDGGAVASETTAAKVDAIATATTRRFLLAGTVHPLRTAGGGRSCLMTRCVSDMVLAGGVVGRNHLRLLRLENFSPLREELSTIGSWRLRRVC